MYSLLLIKKNILATLGQISMKLTKKIARFEKKFFASSVILNAMDSGEGTFISVKKFFFQLNIYSS